MRWFRRFNLWLTCDYEGRREALMEFIAEAEADIERCWAEWDAANPGVERPPKIPVGTERR